MTKMSGIESWEKLLPNQRYNSHLYVEGAKSIEESIYDRILDICAIHQPQEELEIEQTDMFSIEEMASGRVTLNFLQWLVALTGSKTVLEIGTFIGLSTMYLARSLPVDGKVFTIEKFDHFAEIAKRNFIRNDLAGRIELICADAAEVLSDLLRSHKFDFVFIDGNKERYAYYLEMVAQAIHPGGIIVIDDVFFHGDTLNTVIKTEKGRGVQAALDKVKFMGDWQRVLLPVANGILLMRKLSSHSKDIQERTAGDRVRGFS